MLIAANTWTCNPSEPTHGTNKAIAKSYKTKFGFIGTKSNARQTYISIEKAKLNSR